MSHLKKISSVSVLSLSISVSSIFNFVILVENVHDIVVYYRLDVLHVTIIHFNFISVGYLVMLPFFGKWVSITCKKN